MSNEDINQNNELEPEMNDAASEIQDQNVEQEVSPLDKCQGELSDMKDKYLRQVAEFDNFRKRNAKERIELMQTANKDLIIDLLEVLDDMDRASSQMETSDDLEQIRNGTKLVFAKLKRVLESKGLTAMDTAKADFDTTFHEAITEIQAPNKGMQGKVMDELQKGYFLNDKLIRHAKVVIGK